ETWGSPPSQRRRRRMASSSGPFAIGRFMTLTSGKLVEVGAKEPPYLLTRPRQEGLDRFGRATRASRNLGHRHSVEGLAEQHAPTVLGQAEQGGADDVTALDAFEQLRGLQLPGDGVGVHSGTGPFAEACPLAEVARHTVAGDAEEPVAEPTTDGVEALEPLE